MTFENQQISQRDRCAVTAIIGTERHQSAPSGAESPEKVPNYVLQVFTRRIGVSPFRTASLQISRGADDRVRHQRSGRKVARSKNVTVLSGIVGTSLDKGCEIDALAKLPPEKQHCLAEAAQRGEKVSAISARSACDLEEPKMSDGTEEIELGKAIARLRRAQPRNRDTMCVCDALARRLKSGSC